MHAIRLEPADRKRAAEVWARSFLNYPLMTYCCPNSRRRARHLARCLGWMVNYGLRYGEVYTTQDIAGISIWLPPGETQITPWRSFRAGFLPLPFLLGLKHFFTRTMRNERLVHEAHRKTMSGPHWYLSALAVDPSRQGQGIGKTLIRPGFQKADSRNLPCYVETHDEKNVPFYRKQGFELVGAEQIPDSDLTFWYFVREPRRRG